MAQAGATLATRGTIPTEQKKKKSLELGYKLQSKFSHKYFLWPFGLAQGYNNEALGGNDQTH